MNRKTSPHDGQFDDHLLAVRLKRVSQKNLENFYEDAIDKDKDPKNKAKLVEEIVAHYKIMLNNSEFQNKFSIFIRDFVLSARESEHLIEIKNKQAFIQWINSWSKNYYVGNRFNFYKHIDFKLPKQYLCLKNYSVCKTNSRLQDDDRQCCLSFPSEVILLVAYKKEGKSVFSVDKLLAIHDTHEFEIIFRKNTNLVSVRGDNSVVRDFFNSLVLDNTNSLSTIKSFFVGDEHGKKYKPVVKPRLFIKIEELKQALNGIYLDIDAPVSGDQATRIKISLKGMRNIAEETHPILAPAVKEVWTGQEKSRIAFLYNNNTYSFTVTNNGGLYFKQYAPEEVITYVLLKILQLKSSGNVHSSN